MDFSDFFKSFTVRKDEIKNLNDILESDYINFVNENRKEIKNNIPPIGTIVKYIGPPKLTYDNDEWRYLKITDNRIISKPEYNEFIPKIGVIPLDENFRELKSYNERLGIDQFQIIEKEKQTRADSIGYVYLLNVVNTDIYKIGYSKNADKRIGNIKTSSPLDIELVKIFKCYDAFKVEQELHNIFKGKKMNREWFKLDLNDLDILRKFISDFLIEESETISECKLLEKQKNNLPLQSYEIEKSEIRKEHNILIEKYVENCKLAKIGDRVQSFVNQMYLITNIICWDQLDSGDGKPYINYQGYKILKSGKKANKLTPFILLKEDKIISKFIIEYKNEKRILLSKYEKLKKDFSSSFSKFKKGDRVVDIFGESYLIDGVKFHDSFDWHEKAYFTYSGRKIQKNGMVSEDRTESLHNVEKIS